MPALDRILRRHEYRAIITKSEIRLHKGMVVGKGMLLDLQASLQPYFDQHATAATRGGFWAFLIFAGLNVLVAGLCLWIVRTGRRGAAS